MSGNSIGKLLKITTFGESHGPAIGVVVDGFPSNFTVDWDEFQKFIDRRRPGQSNFTTSRNESDHFEVLSGIYQGKTTGAPITFIFRNQDFRSNDYQQIAETFRPGHADFTYSAKYGIRDPRGGGRSSARETVARVAAGALAIQYLAKMGIKINSYVSQIHHIKINQSYQFFSQDQIEKSPVRCPELAISHLMEQAIMKAKEKGDSLGGCIECVVQHIPVGLGEPVFDRLEAQLALAMMSINATKGFEIGRGFESALFYGSENNDPINSIENQKLNTSTNFSGGVLGGISNGMPLEFRVAFKPTSTIAIEQNTVDKEGNPTTLSTQGRHDPCVLPRAVPIVDAMTALVLLDFHLVHHAYFPSFSH